MKKSERPFARQKEKQKRERQMAICSTLEGDEPFSRATVACLFREDNLGNVEAESVRITR